MSYAITIDGPAGSGKSTMAKKISKDLGIIYLDTGAMYRTVGLKAINNDVNPKDEIGVSRIVKDIDLKIAFEDEQQVIYLDNENVNDKIRTPEVSLAASNVAVFPKVRIKMVEMQRKIAKAADVVMDGRDIGTYVLKNAKYKFFLTAQVEERAKRRYKELSEKGLTPDLKKIIEDMNYRDKNDSSRAFAPLKQAEDAVLIDTTNFTIEEVIEKMMEYINGKS